MSGASSRRSEMLADQPMLSYAQNGEDVVLARAFADQANGFYVDIGACHPDEDSVTRHFYDLGWSGVNVEPDRELYAAFLEARPRDTNLCVAIGRARGRLLFHPTATRGHGTLDPGLAAGRSVGRVAEAVPIMRLSDVIDCYGPDGAVIDFLKIDVEGWEAEVIESGDWMRHRPRVLVIEAVGDDGVWTHEAWEHMLFGADYRFAVFDGLNRFYCRAEDADLLLPRIASPANVRDGWVRARDAHAHATISRLQHELTATAVSGDERVAATEREAAARAAAVEAAASARIAAIEQHFAERSLVMAEEADRRVAAAEAAAAQRVAEMERQASELAQAKAREMDEHLDTVRRDAAEQVRATTRDFEARLAAAEQQDAEQRDAAARALADLAAEHAQVLGTVRQQSAEFMDRADRLARELEQARTNELEARRALDAARGELDRLRAEATAAANRSAALAVDATRARAEAAAALRREEAAEARMAELEMGLIASPADPVERIRRTEHEAALRELSEKIDTLVAQRDHAELWLNAVRHSTSWKVTRPFRAGGRFVLRGLRRGK